MNCIVAVITAILALVIHLANTFFGRKDQNLLKDVFQMTVDKTEHRFRLNNRRIK